MNSRLSVFLLALVSCRPHEAQVEADRRPPSTDTALEIVPVISKALDTTMQLEGELSAFESVDLRAKASGYVTSVLVDRGSVVKKGNLLATIAAPELSAQRAEGEAKLLSDKNTLDRLREAAKTPGAVATNEVDVAEASLRADEARVRSLRDLEQYLTVTAPFDGIVTQRNIHPGALVGPQAVDKAAPMFRVEQVTRLRLTVSVPEALAGDIMQGSNTSFTVKTWPGERFVGTTQRVAHSVDERTRSMAVELDVDNPSEKLAPGMFAQVTWPIHRSAPTFFVPPSAVVQSTEKTFILRVKDGMVEQIPIQRGMLAGDLLEIFGPLKQGDLIVRRGSEELRTGTQVVTRLANEPQKP